MKDTRTQAIKSMKSIYTLLLITFISALNMKAQSLNIPLITVSETETSYAPVDEIHFSLSIKTHALEISEARSKNRDIAEKVFEYLDKKKVPEQYIQTKRMRISRNYPRRGTQNQYDGFNAYQVIYVCLKEMDTYDEIIDALLQMEIASIDGPNFKSTAYEEIYKAAQIKALTKARTSAGNMAEALGQKIGKAKLIDSQLMKSFNTSAYSSAEKNASSAGSNSFKAGEIEIKALVKVSFELLE